MPMPRQSGTARPRARSARLCTRRTGQDDPSTHDSSSPLDARKIKPLACGHGPARHPVGRTLAHGRTPMRPETPPGCGRERLDAGLCGRCSTIKGAALGNLTALHTTLSPLSHATPFCSPASYQCSDLGEASARELKLHTAAAMAAPLILMLLVAMFTGSDAAFCVCKSDANPVAMQKAIDYACGKGADCTQITSSGPCFQPSSVVAHCSYACNSYYQKNAGMGATCDFMGVATLTGADPSAGSCKYPASAGGVGTGTGTGMGTGAGTGTGVGTGGVGMGTGTGSTGTSTGTGTGVGTGTGTGMGSMTPPGATSTGMPGSPPFGGGAYGPSGMSPDYSAAVVGRPVASAGLLVAAAAPLLLHLI